MKRTTVFVPEAVERDLHLYASRDNRPTASLVREALEEYVARRREAHVLPSFAGQFASGHSDTAERHEALLFQRLSPHDDSPAAKTVRKPGTQRPPRKRR